MPDLTIAAGGVRALMELAVSKGACRKALAARAELDPAELRDADGRVPLGKYVALMRAGKELCDDPALALHFGEAFDFAEISIVGLIGRAPDADAADPARPNHDCPPSVEVEVSGVSVAERFRLVRGAGRLWMVDARGDLDGHPELTESSFARMACAARRCFGGGQLIKEVHVAHAEPAYRAEYDRIFQVPVFFESGRNALLTDEGWLTRGSALSSRYVFGILGAHAEALRKGPEGSGSMRDRVEGLLTPILHTGEAGVDLIAGKIGVSRQTLFRRLKAEGVTFEKVLDELRRERALHYLGGENASVNETAYLVGFSDPAAFSRAFKRWTGSCPRTMRRAPKAGNGRATFHPPSALR